MFNLVQTWVRYNLKWELNQHANSENVKKKPKTINIKNLSKLSCNWKIY